VQQGPLSSISILCLSEEKQGEVPQEQKEMETHLRDWLLHCLLDILKETTPTWKQKYDQLTSKNLRTKDLFAQLKDWTESAAKDPTFRNKMEEILRTWREKMPFPPTSDSGMDMSLYIAENHLIFQIGSFIDKFWAGKGKATIGIAI
jgi:hypothetical protein